MATGLPDKIYLKIGEVSAATGLPASVLRYWESEFPTLKPKKSTSGQRLYTRKDLELIAEIRRLLYTEKLTIEGARKRLDLARRKGAEQDASGDALAVMIREIREELMTLRDSL